MISASQIGIGALSFQRMIAKSAEADGWISVIVAGAVLQIIVVMIYTMLKTVDGDFYTIHAFVFGEKLSKVFSLVLIVYFCLKTITVLRGYIEVIQVWMFPHLQLILFSVVFLLLVLFIVFGGFRKIVGFAVFSMIVLFFIIPLYLYTIPYLNFSYLSPVFNHSTIEILKGARDMSFTFIGFEIIFVMYPFLKAPQKSQKWAHYGLLFTSFFYLYLAILAFTYFPQPMLDMEIWPSLSMWKIIEMPFVRRFEYIGIATWFIIILPNLCFYLWGASRLIKQSFSVRQKITLPLLTLLCLIVMIFVKDRQQIDILSHFTAKYGFYFDCVYIPLLFICVLIARQVKKGGKKNS